MKRKIQIAPSVLSADFRNLEKQIQLVEKGGGDLIHLDIMDGHFVPNITFGPMVVKAINSATNLKLDTHLMIEKPERYIKDFIEAGSDIITVHVETCTHLHRTIQIIKSYGAKAGVTLNPSTPISSLGQILKFVDLVLIMTVNPGFGGQQFIPEMIEKIETVSRMRDNINPKILIEVDGGVNEGNAKSLAKAGADILVAGNSIFGQQNIPKAIKNLRKAALK
jgi:ribulose-phosphate 3-epimerase